MPDWQQECARLRADVERLEKRCAELEAAASGSITGDSGLLVFLRTVMDPMPIGVAVNVLSTQTFIYMNRRFRQCYGLPETGVHNVHQFFTAAYPDARYREEIRARVMDDIESGDAQRMRWADVIIAHPGQESRHISACNIPLPDKDLMVSTVWDITEHKQAEQALRETQAYLAIAATLAHVGYWEYDARSGAVTWSSEAYRIHGFQPDSLSPSMEMFQRLVHPRDRARVERAADEAMESGRRLDIEYSVLRHDGQEIACHAVADVVHNALGQPMGLRGAVQDITAARQAEESRRQLEGHIQETRRLESLGMFAGGIAHDFNNLLAAILGNADLALDELSPVSPARGSLQEIVKAAKRAADLTRQMLAYAGKTRRTNELVSINEVVREAAHLLDQSAGVNAHIRYQFTSGLSPVRGDAAQLREAILQLVTNAAESLGEKGGAIALRTGEGEFDTDYLRMPPLNDELPAGRYVYVEVADTGCGMARDTAERIFDPFFSTKFTGRGLGLAAVLGIVRAHAGSLKVQSIPALGSTFRVLLPAAEMPAQPADAPRSAPRRDSGTVLLAEDDASVRSLGRRALERRGFTVLAAEDLAAAHDIARQHGGAVNLIMVDSTLAAAAGGAVLRHLRETCGGAPVLLCGDLPDNLARDAMREAGAAGFIHKPYETAVLSDTVRETIESRRGGNAAEEAGRDI